MKPNGFWTNEGFVIDSPEYQAFCREGEVLETSIDPAARKDAWRKMLTLFNQDPWAVPLYGLPMIYAKQKNVVWTPSSLQGSLDLSADVLSFK